jgi:hypothetical protein
VAELKESQQQSLAGNYGQWANCLPVCITATFSNKAFKAHVIICVSDKSGGVFLDFLKVVFLGAGSFREVFNSMRFLRFSMAGSLLEVWACWRGRRSRGMMMMMMLSVSKMPEHHHRGPVSLCLLKKLFWQVSNPQDSPSVVCIIQGSYKEI